MQVGPEKEEDSEMRCLQTLQHGGLHTSGLKWARNACRSSVTHGLLLLHLPRVLQAGLQGLQTLRPPVLRLQQRRQQRLWIGFRQGIRSRLEAAAASQQVRRRRLVHAELPL